jgi:hypothetical protein
MHHSTDFLHVFSKPAFPAMFSTRAIIGLLVLLACTSPMSMAQQQLGVTLPAGSSVIITQGGPPNFADTYVTPFVAAENRTVLAWQAQAEPGHLVTGACGIVVGIQLKVLRAVPNSSLLQVVSAGAVHSPLSILQTRFGGAICPEFNGGSEQAVLDFTESGVNFSPGDIVGVTIMSNPNSGGYFYPLVSVPSDTHLVLRNVEVGNSIDLTDIYTATTPQLAPAISITLGIEVAIDIKPGSYPNSINLSSAGVIPVAILSSESFDAASIDPESLRLSGASVGIAGKSGNLLCHLEDVNSDSRNDLVCQFETAQLTLQTGDTMAEVTGKTLSGVAFRGQDSVRIVPD